jgi:uncharacterized SAM-binding protein YcdF (DUF218 family)
MAGHGRIVAVLGYSRDGETDLHPVCARRLSHAERIASGARRVVLSGYARRHAPAGEAQLMRDAWQRDDVALILDMTSRTTAENAAAIAQIARRLEAAEVVAVTSRWHAPRARALLRAALTGSGITVAVSSPRGPREPLLALREVACVTLLPIQARRLRRDAGRISVGTRLPSKRAREGVS